MSAIRQKAFEQRRFSRTRVSFAAKMFLPAENATLDCRVVDLSPSGAGVICAEPPPLQAFVLLYVGGFDRLGAVTVRMIGDTLGLRLMLDEAKQDKLFTALSRYIDTGRLDATALRRHRRVPGSETATVTRPDGEKLTCAILDISLSGASLKTDGAFAVGETILLGHMIARVVRLHPRGIGVMF
jgi:hypothetical protein